MSQWEPDLQRLAWNGKAVSKYSCKYTYVFCNEFLVNQYAGFDSNFLFFNWQTVKIRITASPKLGIHANKATQDWEQSLKSTDNYCISL